MNAARDTFYRIYKKRENPTPIDSILEQLDFHPLSITLLATVAQQNRWSADRLGKEWETRRTTVLRTEHDKSLAAAIELSLSSPMFRGLGPDARAILGVVAFFPQGVKENNLDWLFSVIPNRTDVFDKFCILSLTYRNNGFVTMLAPLRDYLSPKDISSSSLLCAIKECYFTRISIVLDPTKPNLGDTLWVVSEDANIEYLLDAFTRIDIHSSDVWCACAGFMDRLFLHKSRLTALNPTIERLPDGHRWKPRCLVGLALLFYSVGNFMECKRLLIHALGLFRERGNGSAVASILGYLSSTYRKMDLSKEGIRLAKEAVAIFEQLGDVKSQMECLMGLAWSLYEDGQFDVAEEAASRAAGLIGENGNQNLVCDTHRVFGYIYQSRGETERAIHHFKVALRIARSLNWHHSMFWVHYSLASLYHDEDRLDDANTHLEQAKALTGAAPYYLGLATEVQAGVWYKQRRFEEARSEVLCAVDVYEKFGVTKNLEHCRKLLQQIEEG